MHPVAAKRKIYTGIPLLQLPKRRVKTDAVSDAITGYCFPDDLEDSFQHGELADYNEFGIVDPQNKAKTTCSTHKRRFHPLGKSLHKNDVPINKTFVFGKDYGRCKANSCSKSGLKLSVPNAEALYHEIEREFCGDESLFYRDLDIESDTLKPDGNKCMQVAANKSLLGKELKNTLNSALPENFVTEELMEEFRNDFYGTQCQQRDTVETLSKTITDTNQNTIRLNIQDQMILKSEEIVNLIVKPGKQSQTFSSMFSKSEGVKPFCAKEVLKKGSPSWLTARKPFNRNDSSEKEVGPQIITGHKETIIPKVRELWCYVNEEYVAEQCQADDVKCVESVDVTVSSDDINRTDQAEIKNIEVKASEEGLLINKTVTEARYYSENSKTEECGKKLGKESSTSSAFKEFNLQNNNEYHSAKDEKEKNKHVKIHRQPMVLETNKEHKGSSKPLHENAAVDLQVVPNLDDLLIEDSDDYIPSSQMPIQSKTGFGLTRLATSFIKTKQNPNVLKQKGHCNTENHNKQENKLESIGMIETSVSKQEHQPQYRKNEVIPVCENSNSLPKFQILEDSDIISDSQNNFNHTRHGLEFLFQDRKPSLKPSQMCGNENNKNLTINYSLPAKLCEKDQENKGLVVQNETVSRQMPEVKNQKYERSSVQRKVDYQNVSKNKSLATEPASISAKGEEFTDDDIIPPSGNSDDTCLRSVPEISSFLGNRKM